MSDELKSGDFERQYLLRILDTLVSLRTKAADVHFSEHSLHELSSLYPQVQQLDFSKTFWVYAVLSQEVEGCYPMVLERWEITFTPGHSLAADFSSAGQVMLRSLMLSCVTLPARHKLSKLDCTVYYNRPDLLTWSPCVSRRDILTFPAIPMKFEGPSGAISVSAEYIAEVPKPQIAKQDIASRLRLTSEDNSDAFEMRDLRSYSPPLNETSQSTETSPPFQRLSDMKMRRPESPCAACIDVLTSDCIDDHSSIGFVPMSHSVFNDLSESPDEDEVKSLEFETTPQAYNPFLSDKDSTSEDAKVACFRSNCEKAHHLSLFNSKFPQRPQLFTTEASQLSGQAASLQVLRDRMLSV
jgi:hypothetical protein